MWGRKAKRIRELDAMLNDALENLVNIVVMTPGSMRQTLQAARKDTWYRVSFTVRVGEMYQETRDHYVAEEPGVDYFDGESGNRGPDVNYAWTDETQGWGDDSRN